MAFSKTYRTSTGHDMHVQQIPWEEVPAGMEHTGGFKSFYIVRNWDAKGIVFFYMAKGLASDPGQVCVWYRNTKKMWSSFGRTIPDALNGAIRDGWMYA